MSALTLAEIVLAVHLVVIGFNLFGIIAIPLGGWRGWTFVRGFWWRALHVAALAVVAIQAVVGRACFLTLLQDALAGSTAGHAPLIMRWVNGVIFWSLPPWVFAALYVVVFAYVLGLLWLVPPAWPRRRGWQPPSHPGETSTCDGIRRFPD